MSLLKTGSVCIPVKIGLSHGYLNTSFKHLVVSYAMPGVHLKIGALARTNMDDTIRG